MTWISVSDRLPKKGKWISCRLESGETILAKADIFGLGGRGHWYISSEEGIDTGVSKKIYTSYWTDVTHWMPLPKPPKVKK